MSAARAFLSGWDLSPMPSSTPVPTAKPHSCQVCGKSFRRKYLLTQHNLIHSGVKPFSCDSCGKCFNVKMNLRQHMRRHLGDRPYKCPYCTSIGFFRKKMLKDHIVKTHPQRPMPLELMSADLELAMGMSNDSSHSDDLDGVPDPTNSGLKG